MSATAAIPDDAARQRLLEARPMWRIVLGQFVEHRMAVAGVFVIAFFLGVALLAPMISAVTGLDPNRQNVLARYQPLLSWEEASPSERELRVQRFLQGGDRTALADHVRSLGLAGADLPQDEVLYQLVSSHEPAQLLGLLRDGPTPDSAAAREQLGDFERVVEDFRSFHLLGTDELGRDVFIRLVYGTQVSITVGLLVALISGLIGLVIGSVAGYYGGRLDALLMRFTDALLSLPILVVLIVVSAVDLGKLLGGTPLAFITGHEHESVIKMVIILCAFSWMQAARLVRGSILSIKEQEFVLAARVLGARDRTIIATHVVPNVIAPLLVAVTLGIGNAILFEAALSFLGLGIQPPTPSWGNMLHNAQEMVQHAPMLAILPGLLILFTVISFNYLGDGVRDAIDPRGIRR
ncbi:MAG: ABC transporter permease [Steroidobacteraceae bacterium]|jgi:peptide/nickel transport system permease protein|nr:ABC transporter permease [Steroidobacteraceae bacterium]